MAGGRFVGLNGGPQLPFTEAVSLIIDCADQAEVDRLWEAPTQDGGKPVQCGWLKDRYGVSWQIVPTAMLNLLADPNRERAGRVMQAMMAMTKLDIDAREKA